MPSASIVARHLRVARTRTILFLAVIAACGSAEASVSGPPDGNGGNGGNGGGNGGGSSNAIASGRVTDPQGRPIAGATIVVNNALWFNRNIVLKTGSDGSYRTELPASDSWYVRGTTTIAYHGREYTVELKPDYPGAFAGTAGHVVNLQWVMTGEVAPDFGRDGFYGGSVEIETGWDLPDLAGVSVTLTPVGALLDGSTGTTISRSVDGSAGTLAIRDVPIGRYAIRVVRNGTPLVIRMRGASNYVSDITADFEPAYTGATAYGLYFMVATTNW